MNNRARSSKVAVIGSGPAGMGSALYLAREGLEVVVYEQAVIGGLLPQIVDLQNYPGFSGSGEDLAQKMRTQAESFGAKFEYGECESLKSTGEKIELLIDDEKICVDAVVVATGCEPRKLDLLSVGPEKISYCATCDAPLYRGKKVLVVGGGNSALQESLHIAEFASQIVIINRSKLRASEALIARVREIKKIEIIEDTDPVDYAQTHTFDGYFVFIGSKPATTFLPEEVLSAGYVDTDSAFMTKIPGVFAAGSVRKGAISQVIIGAGEGAEVAISVRDWLIKRSQG